MDTIDDPGRCAVTRGNFCAKRNRERARERERERNARVVSKGIQHEIKSRKEKGSTVYSSKKARREYTAS